MTTKFEIGKIYRIHGTKLLCKVLARNEDTEKVTMRYCHADGVEYGNKMTRKVRVYGNFTAQWESVNLEKGFYMAFCTDATQEVQ